MLKHAPKTALFLALMLGSCASSPDAQESIGQLPSDTHAARIAAIKELGASRDPGAGEMLIAALEDPGANAAEREETWFEVAQGLGRLAEKGLVGEEALPALDQLAARSSSVEPGASDEGSALGRPGLPYDRAAADAARTIRLKGAQRSRGKPADGTDGKTEADFLAELAWIQRVEDGERVHETSLEKLKKLGAEGVASSARLVGQVRPRSRTEMVAYFRELHAETGDEACAPALLALASSQYEESWRPALVALREMGDARTARALVRRLQNGEVLDTPRTHLALAALGGIGSEEAIPFLVDLLGNASRDIARSASQALVEIGPAAVPDVLVAFDHIDRQNRLMAARTLSYLGDSKGREAVRRFLGTVRSDDEETLGEIRRNLMH